MAQTTAARSTSARVAFKLGLGLLGLVAIVTEVATLVERGSFDATRFFAYFTILSNVLVAGTLILSAVLTASGRGAALDAVRGAVTVYILVVGIGFAVLLSGLDDLVFTAVPWDNVVLHYLVPIGVLIDFVVDPPERRLPFGSSLVWLVFPLAYLAVSLVRGEASGWYPYPFLDPATDGVAAVAVTSLGLLALGAALTAGVCALSRRGAPRPSD
ncbi:Pr6Pr family membrane protein [Aeromicrobium alkaliterrae]|uniref:Integral membrane regulator n=1 Tax=Aeromicrobium alkaliterrae TaxID=302168 RepID=A0ABP4W1M1_9ACTN